MAGRQERQRTESLVWSGVAQQAACNLQNLRGHLGWRVAGRWFMGSPQELAVQSPHRSGFQEAEDGEVRGGDAVQLSTV